MKPNNVANSHLKRLITVAISGILLGIAIILVTLEISHRNIISFVTAQEKYVISVEAAFLAVFLVEVLVRILSYNFRTPEMANYGVRLRILVRVIGYLIATVSVVSVLASNPALAISVGAVIGVVIAFATQNITSSILATILILNTRILRIGEEVTVSGITGTVADINLTHTIISVGEDIVFVPNSVIIYTSLRRKKRIDNPDHDTRHW
jgi:small-conductance mechanosensitive channel